MNKNGHIFHLLFYSLTHSVPYTCTTPQTQKTYWYEPYIKCEGWTKRIAAGVREDFMVIIPQKTLRWVYRFCRCQRRCRLFPLAGVGGDFFGLTKFCPPPPYHFLSYVPNFRLKALRKLRCGARKSFSVGKFRCGNNTQRTESLSYNPPFNKTGGPQNQVWL